MKKTEFWRLLEEKAEEQRLMMESSILPEWAGRVGEWLGVNPWRVIGLMAIVGYGVMRLVGGERVREIVLKIFGGY